MYYMAEYAAFLLRYGGHGPSTLPGLLFFALSMGAYFLAGSDETLEKLCADPALRKVMKVTIRIIGVILFAAAVVFEVTIAN